MDHRLPAARACVAAIISRFLADPELQPDRVLVMCDGPRRTAFACWDGPADQPDRWRVRPLGRVDGGLPLEGPGGHAAGDPS